MNSYMCADFRRIFKRIPRIVALICLFGVLVAVMLFMAKGRSPYELIDYMIKGLPYACAAVGLVEFLAVYTEDLKAKTMQIAIGTGISRSRVILAKWLECIALCVIDGAIIFGIIAACSAFRGAVFSGEAVTDLILIILFALLKVTGSAAFTMIFVFWTQNPMVGLLVYLAMSFGIVNAIVDTVVGLGPLSIFSLDRFMFVQVLDTARTRMLIGSFSIPHFAGIIIYLIFFFFIACRVFRRRELEF